MRESIGSMGIFAIVITFIVLFTSYLAFSVNYAKAFKIKNHVIDMIEDDPGFEDHRNSFKSELQLYLTSQNYGASGKCPGTITHRVDNSMGYEAYELVDLIGTEDKCAFAIYKPKGLDGAGCTNNPTRYSKKYYMVVDFFSVNMPIISTWTSFSVYGETKTLSNYNQQACM